MHFKVFTIARFTLLETMRNRLLWMILVALLSAFTVTEFMGDIAVTDQREIQLALLANMLRVFGVVLIAVITVSAGIRELQDKTLEFVLALPVSRTGYFSGKLIGYLILCLLISVMSGLLLMWYGDINAVIVWCSSYLLELTIVACLGLLSTYTFRQMAPALATVFLFYLLSRALNAIVLISQGPLVKSEGPGQQFIDGFFALLNWLLPSLDRFSQTSWLVYGDYTTQSVTAMLIQAVIYIPLLSAVALVDFHRKNISA